MRDLAVLFLHLLVTVARIAGPGGARSVVAESALVKHQLLILNRSRWIPRSDRSAVLGEWRGDHQPVLDRLPLNFDDTTLKTIEQIDVLWLKGRAITRAFEVEHTTSIYSGILR